MAYEDGKPAYVAGANRFNQGKLRFDLIPPSLDEEVAKALGFGAAKYGDNNWRKGLTWTSVIASLRRHLNAFENCEDIDEESGLLHLSCMAANIAFLIEFQKTHPELDDRYRTKN